MGEGYREKVNRDLLMRNTASKRVIYFFLLSLLFLMSGALGTVADAKERNLPIGEMISKGEVKFEVRENAWKSVEPFHFPVFKGVKIKTEKGVSVIALANRSQIEVGQHSMISFNQDDHLFLFQGGFDFRIPSSAEMSFKVGSLSIIKSRVLQAAKNRNLAPAKNEETVGSLFIHSNGSLTVKSVQGELSILDQDHVVLASLPQRETLTIPSAIVSGIERVMVAQAGDPEEENRKSEEGWLFSGTTAGAWASILLNAALGAGIVSGAMEDPICR